MKWEIAATVFFVASLVVFMYPVKQPEWTTKVMDSEHPERFVDMAEGPAIVYFNEKERGGVLFFASKSGDIVKDIDYYFNGRKWAGGTVDSGLYKGMFISSASDEGMIHASYQDATPGNEKLMYAVYNGSGWKKEVVDDVSSGISVGMFSSISIAGGKPVIFYHTEQGRKFGYAIKENGSWNRKTLESGAGWSASTAVCDGKVFAAYRSRDEKDVFFGTLDTESGQWSSRNLGVTTQFGLDVAAKGCKPYIAYFDNPTSDVKFIDVTEGRSYRIGSGKLSRISMAVDGSGFHVLYHVDGEGLYYAYSRDGKEWETTLISQGRRDGWFNSIAASNGNIYIASLNKTALKYMEYNVSASGTVKALLNGAAILLLAAGSVCTLKALRKKKIQRKK